MTDFIIYEYPLSIRETNDIMINLSHDELQNVLDEETQSANSKISIGTQTSNHNWRFQNI